VVYCIILKLKKNESVTLMAKAKRKRSLIVRLLIIGVSGYMIFTLIGLWNNLSESNSELKKLEAEKAVKQSEIDEYKTLLSGSKEKIIEKAARERLGFEYSDAIIYQAY